MGKIFDSGTGGRALGRIEADGKVYDNPVAGMGRCIGRVESSGKVFDHAVSGACVGRIEKDRVYDHSVAGNIIGRVERDGRIFDRSAAGTCIGRSEAPHIQLGAAALILLLR